MGGRAAVAVLAGAMALAWFTALPGAFQFDDWRIIVADERVHSWPALLASLPGIRPLTRATYALNWWLDPGPAGFVAFNLLCHFASALLVLALARRWLRVLAPDCPRARADWAALLTALLFALHPAQTEAVTYIAGRSVALSACLYLGALYAWERARSARHGWLALSLAFYALALAARETAWTLPLAIVLVECARGTNLRQAIFTTRWHWLVAVAAVAIAALSPGYRRLLAASLDFRGPWANLAAQVDGIAYLVTHPLLTLRLNIDPDLAPSTLADAGWWGAALALVACIGFGFQQLRRRPWLGFAVLWFFLQLLPTNSLVARFDLANDRQLYLALIGPAMLLAVPLARAHRRIVANAIAGLLLAVVGVATLMRNADYHSEVALWTVTVRDSPNKARGWNNLGQAHEAQGERPAARAAYERALALDPAHYKARQNLEELGR